MVTQILLSDGRFALVDPQDAHLVSGRRWRVGKHRSGSPAAVVSGSGSEGTIVLMHRLILGDQAPPIVDHINGNPLDNRRENLRSATRKQNLRNRPRHRTNKSGYKGVYLDARSKRWRCQIRSDGRKWCIGSFDSPQAAHEAYCAYAKLLHGEFARFN